MGSLLFADAVVAVDGAENKSSIAGAVKSRTFNVLNYGAVADGRPHEGFRRAGVLFEFPEQVHKRRW